MAEIADAVIVGGGILGVMLAYELAKRTFRVTLLEAHALGAGVSGSGFGWINASSKIDMEEDYFRLNAHSVGQYENLIAQEGHRPEAMGIRFGGTLFWVRGTDTAGAEALRNRAARLWERGYPAAILSQAEMEALEPRLRFRFAENAPAEGLYAPADKWADGARLTRYFADAARKLKADIREYSPVTEFSCDLRGAVSGVRTADAQFVTRTVILAAGAQTPRCLALLTEDPIIRLCAPVKRVAGVLVDTGAQEGEVMASRTLYPPDAGGLHMRPNTVGGLLLGADDTDIPAQQGVLDSRRLHEIGRDLALRASQYLPDWNLPEAVAQQSPYVCYRSIPADERPIVGAVSGLRGAYVLVTHSGVTLAPYLAHLLAEEIVLRRSPEALKPYRPDRFLVPPL